MSKSKELENLKRLAEIAKRELTAAHYIDSTRRMQDEVEYWAETLRGLQMLIVKLEGEEKKAG